MLIPKKRSVRRPVIRTVAAVLLIAGIGPADAASPSEADYARVNAALAVGHAVPRYETLFRAAAAFEAAALSTCRMPPPRSLDTARAAFHAAMDAWMAIEHVQHGPVELYLRKFRLQFWPDKRGRGARQMRELLSRRDDAVLAPDRFRSESVAVQGFPAAERLLFGERLAPAVIGGADGDYACRLLVAIGRNLAEITAGLVADWTSGTKPFVGEIRGAGARDARYPNHKEATAGFVKGFHTMLEIVVDQKTRRVLGDTIASAHPRRAESWRSARSHRNIVLNLEALQAMYEGENGPGLKDLLGPADAGLAALLSGAFRQSLATARSIDRPLAKAVADPAARATVARLATEIRALKALVSGRLAPALGTPLGFNALDGD